MEHWVFADKCLFAKKTTSTKTSQLATTCLNSESGEGRWSEKASKPKSVMDACLDCFIIYKTKKNKKNVKTRKDCKNHYDVDTKTLSA